MDRRAHLDAIGAGVAGEVAGVRADQDLVQIVGWLGHDGRRAAGQALEHVEQGTTLGFVLGSATAWLVNLSLGAEASADRG